MGLRLSSLLANWTGRLLLGASLSLSLLLGLLLGLLLVVHSESGSRQALAFSMPHLNRLLPGEIRYSGIAGELGGELQLFDVEVLDDRGEICLRASRLLVSWDLWDLTGRSVAIRRVQLDEPKLSLVSRSDGRLNLTAAFVAEDQGADQTANTAPPWRVSLASVAFVGGAVELFSEAESEASIYFDGLDLSGSYLLDAGQQRIDLESLSGSLQRPLKLPDLRLSGAFSIAQAALEVAGIEAFWKGSRLSLTGSITDLASPRMELLLGMDDFDLKALGELFGESRLRGSLGGQLKIQGPPAALFAKGELELGGARIRILELALDPALGELGHRIRVGVTDLALSELLDVPAELPPKVTGSVVWSGSRSSASGLTGELELTFDPLKIGVSEVELRRALLGLRGDLVELRALSAAVAGGRLSAVGSSSLQSGDFSLDVEANFDSLTELGESLGLLGLSGGLELRSALAGNWREGISSVITSSGELQAAALSQAQRRCERLEGSWNLEFGFGAEQISVVGNSDLRAKRLLVPGLPPLSWASLKALGKGSLLDLEVRAGDGPELIAAVATELDWRRSPILSLRGDRLELLIGDLVLQSSEPFVVTGYEGRYSLDRLLIESGVAQLAVQAQYDSVAGSLAASLRASGFEFIALGSALQRLGWMEQSPEAGFAGGKLDLLQLKVRGALASPTLLFSTRVQQLEVAGRGPLDLQANLQAQDGSVRGELALGDFLLLELNKLPLALRLVGGSAFELDPEGGWDLKGRLERIGLKELSVLSPALLTERLGGGQLRGGFQLSGSSQNPKLRLDLGLSELELAEQRLHGQLGLLVEEGVLRFEDALLRTAGAGRVLELKGQAASLLGPWLLHHLGPKGYRKQEAPPMFGELELSAQSRKLPMGLVHLFAPGLTPLTGALQGEVRVTGSAVTPTGQAELRLLGGRVGQEKLRDLRIDLGLQGSRLSGELLVQGQSGGSLGGQLSSSIRLKPGLGMAERFSEPDLRAELTGDGFPLALLTAFVPGTSEPSGELRVDGVVGGSLAEPEPQIDVELLGARLCHEGTSICYEELNLGARLESSRLSLTDLSFKTVPQVRNPLDLVRSARSTRDRARFSMDGFVLLKEGRPGWTEVDVRFEQAWASYTEQLKVQLDGALKVRGYHPALKLSGETELQNVRLDLGRSSIRRETQSLDLAPQLRVHRGEGLPQLVTPSSPAEQVQEPSLLDRLLQSAEADVNVRLGNNVRANLAVGVAGQGSEALAAVNLLGSIEPELVLGGALNLNHQDQASSITGAIQMERGSRLKVLTRDFEMEPGSSIEFVGKIPDSQLNLRATYSSRFGPVTVVVTERMASPSIRFESEVFEDQADILSVLVTGKPIAELSTAEGSQALSGVAGALAGFGTKAFGRYTPFDSLVVDIGDDLSSGSAEAGKALGPKVFLLTRFRWGTEEGENRIEGQLEVQLDPRLYLETVMGDRLQGAIQLVWKRQF